MKVSVFENPDALYFPVPNTSEAPIYSMWETNPVLSKALPDYWSFTVICHPITRLMNAYADKLNEGDWSLYHFIEGIMPYDIACVPMSTYLIYTELDHIGKLEDPNCLLNIQAHLGLTKVPKPVILHTSEAMKLFNNLDTHYKETVIEFYKDDFKEYGYEVPNF